MLKFQWLWGFLWGSRVSWLGLGLGRGKGVKALVLLGRAWVSSLPNFFLGKYFHFWKLPPLFCINSRDNVYYPIFLTCYIIRIIGIKYTVSCIIGIGASVKTLSQNERFSLG